jgi:hypothetical protein
MNWTLNYLGLRAIASLSSSEAKGLSSSRAKEKNLTPGILPEILRFAQNDNRLFPDEYKLGLFNVLIGTGKKHLEGKPGFLWLLSLRR